MKKPTSLIFSAFSQVLCIVIDTGWPCYSLNMPPEPVARCSELGEPLKASERVAASRCFAYPEEALDLYNSIRGLGLLVTAFCLLRATRELYLLNITLIYSASLPLIHHADDQKIKLAVSQRPDVNRVFSFRTRR